MPGKKKYKKSNIEFINVSLSKVEIWLNFSNSPSKDNPFKTFLDKNEKLITYNNLILQIQEKKTKIEILKNEIN